MPNFRLLALVSLLSVSHSYAGILDFEDADQFGGDNAAISPGYFASQGFGITALAGASESDASDVLFAFEATGRDGTDGYWNRGMSGRDDALSGDLGNYFMKAGVGDLSYNDAKYFKMTIDYTSLSTAASGEIWDIDGPEQYQVTAFDANGDKINTLESPHGGLDGQPWLFSIDIDPDTGKTIDRIEITATGTGTLRGFAFDNFDAFTAAAAVSSTTAHSTPLPTSLPLGVAGIALLIARHRRSTSPPECEEDSSETDDVSATG